MNVYRMCATMVLHVSMSLEAIIVYVLLDLQAMVARLVGYVTVKLSVIQNENNL